MSYGTPVLALLGFHKAQQFSEKEICYHLFKLLVIPHPATSKRKHSLNFLNTKQPLNHIRDEVSVLADNVKNLET